MQQNTQPAHKRVSTSRGFLHSCYESKLGKHSFGEEIPDLEFLGDDFQGFYQAYVLNIEYAEKRKVTATGVRPRSA